MTVLSKLVLVVTCSTVSALRSDDGVPVALTADQKALRAKQQELEQVNTDLEALKARKIQLENEITKLVSSGTDDGSVSNSSTDGGGVAQTAMSWGDASSQSGVESVQLSSSSSESAQSQSQSSHSEGQSVDLSEISRPITLDGDVVENAENQVSHVSSKKDWERLILAAEIGDLAKVNELLLENEDIDVNECGSEYGKTALFVASELGYPEVVHRLLEEEHINVNQVTEVKGLDRLLTPILIAADQNRAEVVQKLLAHPDIDLSIANRALFIATHHFHLEILDVLMSHPGIDVNYTIGKGTSAFQIACSHGHAAVAQKFLNHDEVDVNQRDSRWQTALHDAAAWRGEGRPDDRSKIVKLLLGNKKVEVNPTDFLGMTPLCLACLNGHVDSIQALLADDRVDVNRVAVIGMSPCMIASLFCHFQVLKEFWAHSRFNPVRSIVAPFTSHMFLADQDIVVLFYDNYENEPNAELYVAGIVVAYLIILVFVLPRLLNELSDTVLNIASLSFLISEVARKGFMLDHWVLATIMYGVLVCVIQIFRGPLSFVGRFIIRQFGL